MNNVRIFVRMIMLVIMVLNIITITAQAAEEDEETPEEAEARLKNTINNAMYFIMGIGGAIFTIIIIWRGIQLMHEGVNPERRAEILEGIKWAIIGLIIVLLAPTLVIIISGWTM